MTVYHSYTLSEQNNWNQCYKWCLENIGRGKYKIEHRSSSTRKQATTITIHKKLPAGVLLELRLRFS